jgi:hypothetical protein
MQDWGRGELKERDHLEDLVVNRKTTLKWILKQQN